MTILLWTIDMHNNMDGFHNNYAEEKKPDKEYFL